MLRNPIKSSSKNVQCNLTYRGYVIYCLARHSIRRAFCCLKIDWNQIKYVQQLNSVPLPNVSAKATLFQANARTNGFTRWLPTFNKWFARAPTRLIYPLAGFSNFKAFCWILAAPYFICSKLRWFFSCGCELLMRTYFFD